MKESVRTMSALKSYMLILRPSTAGATSSPYLSLLSSARCVHGHGRARWYISIRSGAIGHMKESSGYLIGWGKKCKNWRVYHESSALR